MPHFQDLQQQFISHIKDPSGHPAPVGMEDRRMKIYRDLFFNNIQGFLSNGFPVLASLYSEQQWQQLARYFFSQHQCQSPYFVDISQEFVDYLQNNYRLTDSDPPFLLELAHYEWVELEVSIRQEAKPVNWWSADKDINEIQLSPLAWVLSYPYPVHKISTDYQPQDPGEPVYLVVYRNSDDKVEFTEVNAITAHLLTLVEQSSSISISTLIAKLCQDIPTVPAEQLQQGAKQIVDKMLKQQILTIA